VIVNWLPGAPWLGLTLTAAADCASAGVAESTAAAAAIITAAAMRRAGTVVQGTGGGYVEAGGACERSRPTAACPLGQKARKSQRPHHGPAVVG